MAKVHQNPNTPDNRTRTKDFTNDCCGLDKYGITVEQLNDIQARLQEIDLHEHVESFADTLSGSCLTGLIICFGSWEIIHQPKRIAFEGIQKLQSAAYLSPESLEELAEALYTSGYIDEPHKWLKLISLSL